jgi:hypothetical protein
VPTKTHCNYMNATSGKGFLRHTSVLFLGYLMQPIHTSEAMPLEILDPDDLVVLRARV